MNAANSFRCSRKSLQCFVPTTFQFRRRVPKSRINLTVQADFYAVAIGRKPGIYETWDDCQRQTNKFSGAVFKKFKSLDEAENFMRINGGQKLKNQQSNLVRRRPLIEQFVGSDEEDNFGIGQYQDRKFGRWEKQKSQKVDRELTTNYRSNYQQYQDEELAQDFEDTEDTVQVLEDVTVYFDGVIQKKNQIAGIGAVIKVDDSSKLIASGCKYIDEEISPQEASLKAVLLGLELAAKISFANLSVVGDSKYVIGALNSEKKIQKENLLQIFEEIQVHIKKFNVTQIKLVSGSENSFAEALSKQALNTKQDSFDVFLDEIQLQTNKSQKQQQQQQQQVGQTSQKSVNGFQGSYLEDDEDFSKVQKDSEFSEWGVPDLKTLEFVQEEQSENLKVQKEIEFLESKMPVLKKLQKLRDSGYRQNPVVIQFDGACEPNPGRGGCGVVIFDEKTRTPLIQSFWYIGGNQTNNVAEYKAVILGLVMAKAIGAQDIRIQGDSKLVINGISGEYTMRVEHLQILCEEVMRLASRDFQSFDKKNHTKHIFRDSNQYADGLSKQALYNGKTKFKVQLLLSEREIQDLLY